MEVRNTVVIELTHKEAILLAKFLPYTHNVDDESEEFAAKVRDEICNQLSIKPWDL